MKSLLIISLPRSLSSMVFDQARQSLKLCTPEWASSGEILNPDRWFSGDQPTNDNFKFLSPKKTFQTKQILSFLSDTIKLEGHI